MNLYTSASHITVEINGQSETMTKGEFSRIISRPQRMERYTFERDHFSTDEQIEPPCA